MKITDPSMHCACSLSSVSRFFQLFLISLNESNAIERIKCYVKKDRRKNLNYRKETAIKSKHNKK